MLIKQLVIGSLISLALLGCGADDTAEVDPQDISMKSIFKKLTQEANNNFNHAYGNKFSGVKDLIQEDGKIFAIFNGDKQVTAAPAGLVVIDPLQLQISQDYVITTAGVSNLTRAGEKLIIGHERRREIENNRQVIRGGYSYFKLGSHATKFAEDSKMAGFLYGFNDGHYLYYSGGYDLIKYDYAMQKIADFNYIEGKFGLYAFLKQPGIINNQLLVGGSAVFGVDSDDGNGVFKYANTQRLAIRALTLANDKQVLMANNNRVGFNNLLQVNFAHESVTQTGMYSGKNSLDVKYLPHHQVVAVANSSAQTLTLILNTATGLEMDKNFINVQLPAQPLKILTQEASDGFNLYIATGNDDSDNNDAGTGVIKVSITNKLTKPEDIDGHCWLTELNFTNKKTSPTKACTWIIENQHDVINRDKQATQQRVSELEIKYARKITESRDQATKVAEKIRNMDISDTLKTRLAEFFVNYTAFLTMSNEEKWRNWREPFTFISSELPKNEEYKSNENLQRAVAEITSTRFFVISLNEIETLKDDIKNLDTLLNKSQ